MTELRYGRDYYSIAQDMLSWAEENIGPGGWFHTKDDEPDENIKWRMNQVFGNTTFYFTNEHDAAMFALRWN